MLVNSLFLILSSTSLYSQNESVDQLLSQELDEGEAIIWYLYHSGWAVRTRSYFLIFDYWEKRDKSTDFSLHNGFINPDELSDQKTYVFISHAHEDHYDPVIFSWRDFSDVKYIFGWESNNEYTDLSFGAQRELKKLDGIEIQNIHHSFDNIPESAFMVYVDGLSIYHSGDHGHSQGGNNKVFRENINYLKSLNKSLDIVFTHTFGGERYTIQKLSPKIVFPMHDGDNEKQYKKFADEFGTRKRRIIAAERPGDSFIYRSGTIERTGNQ